jgi:CRP/FNR family transcriptional regulator, cyclic AMP receptor protein
MPTMRSFSRSTPLADKLIFLRQVPLWAHLTDQELISFCQYLRLRKYARGQIVFEQGDLGHTQYIILQGKVRVFRLTSSGLETTLTILGKEDLVGEFAVIDQYHRSASACAIGKCVLLQISAVIFFGFVRERPNLALSMMHVLVVKIR